MSSSGAAAAAVAILILIPCVAAPAAGQGLWVRSTTYSRGLVRPTHDGVAVYAPFYEHVELRTRDLGTAGLSVNTSFWGMLDAVDEQEEGIFTGDVTTLFVDYHVPRDGKLAFLHGFSLTAGRQLVAFGPTVLEQVDGGKAHYIHKSGVEVGLFGGAPTGRRFRFHPWPLGNDDYGYTPSWVLGGRVGYVNLGLVSGGITYVHRRYDGIIADHDLGADVTVSPLSWLDVSGMATLSLAALRPKEGRGTVSLRPWRPVTLSAGYRYSSPDLWVPRTSIFAVFSEQTFHEAHLDARWRATRRVTVEAGYGRRFYGAHTHGADSASAAAAAAAGTGTHEDELLGANRASLRAVYRHDRGARAVAEAERVEEPGADNASNRVRVGGSVPLYLLGRKLSLVADVDFLVLDQTLRGARVGLVAGGYLRVPILENLGLLAGGSGGFTPLLDSVGTFTVRLTWELDAFVSDSGVTVRRGG